MAERVDLDLVVVAPNAKPPVAKLWITVNSNSNNRKRKEMKKKQKLSMLKKFV